MRRGQILAVLMQHPALSLVELAVMLDAWPSDLKPDLVALERCHDVRKSRLGGYRLTCSYLLYHTLRTHPAGLTAASLRAEARALLPEEYRPTPASFREALHSMVDRGEVLEGLRFRLAPSTPSSPQWSNPASVADAPGSGGVCPVAMWRCAEAM